MNNALLTAYTPRFARAVSALLPMVLILPLALAAGCSTTRYEERIDLAGIERLAVDASNFSGSITVRTDRRLAQADTPQAFVSARVRPGRGDAETRAAVEQGIDFNVELVREGTSGVLRAIMLTAFPETTGHEAHLLIEVPRLDGVRLAQDDGWAAVDGVAGTVDIANTGGGVRVRTATPLAAPVRILNAGGGVWLQLPKGSKGVLDLLALDGVVELSDRTGGTLDTRSATEGLRATLNRGDNEVLVRTDVGGIHVLLIDDPMRLNMPFRAYNANRPINNTLR